MKKMLLPLAIAAGLAASFVTGCTTSSPKASAKSKIIPFTGMVQNIFAAPSNVGGIIAGCPGTYAGSVVYTKPVVNGWGWAPDTNNTSVFTAADGGGRSDTKIVYSGKSGDKGCNATSVTVPNPPTSTVYRFTIYFPSNVPSTNYPIV